MMEDNKVKFNSIDEYIGLFPSEVQVYSNIKKCDQRICTRGNKKISIKCQRLLCVEI